MIPNGDFVLDCSVTMGWCFEDQADADGTALLRGLVEHRAHVPTLWALEVSNVLIAAERRGAFQPAASDAFLRLLAQLPIFIDPSTPLQAGGRTLDLARAHGLSAYDAAYLELALRSGIPLATRDKALQAAAATAGVEVW